MTVAPGPITIIEGISSSRLEWAERLCFNIWVDTPRATRLQRGLARGGVGARKLWESWMAAEDAFFAMDQPWERANAIVSGSG